MARIRLKSIDMVVGDEINLPDYAIVVNTKISSTNPDWVTLYYIEPVGPLSTGGPVLKLAKG